ncbi:MAG: tetratricopeptide repeat protein [Flavobacteriales bacterium]|nr:tetratricopeptide repeat protein [Flavobacteriales bacterium]MCB9168038.1 tetratricopeptide repeat protein [Flavobacteriales bacterium]
MWNLRHVLLLCSVLPALSGQGQDPASLLSTGDSLIRTGHYQKALDAFDEAVKVAPSAATYSARARAYFAMDRIDRFVSDVQRAIALDSMYAEANYQRALYAYQGEDFPSAERYATRGLENAEDAALRTQLLLLRGQTRAELHSGISAAEDLREGLKARPDDIEANATLARVLDEMHDHEGALPVLAHLCELEPENVGHWTNRGFELAALDRHEDALAMYAKALDIDKDEPVALSDRAYSLLKLGREDEAMKDVEKSLRYYPANAFALRTRALLRLRKGDRDKACSDLSLARILGGVDDVDALIQEHCNNLPRERRQEPSRR